MTTRSVATSVRLPEDVQLAAKAAVDHGLARSLTELIVDALRDRLVVLANEDQDLADRAEVKAALEEHFTEHPEARPSLAEVAMAGAQLDGNPAADHPELIERAVADLGEEAHFEDVLHWVRGALASKAAPDSKRSVA
jgi:hypothetical protein